MITQDEYDELRTLVTRNSGAELSILEGYKALLSCIEQLEQDLSRARRATGRREDSLVHALEVLGAENQKLRSCVEHLEQDVARWESDVRRAERILLCRLPIPWLQRPEAPASRQKKCLE